MKKLLMVGILMAMWSMAAPAQTSSTSITQVMQASDIAPKPFAGCNGDMITLGGDFTETTTQWVDDAGDTHTRTQVISSNLTASSSNDYTYTVIFSQKQIETVSDGITNEETITFRLKLLGAGPLNNQMIFMEAHFTNPQGIGNGNNTNHVWSKCTG